ncbi:NAD-dependent epimerase/dehydratase [Solirubrobacter taibaiensis]|nr:NAD-dependent epimerase/dehydratase [Solirubrobacter taibaiensis]
MTRVLVTGATGFIGRQTLAPLRALGFDVHATARTPPAEAGDVVWHAADLLDAGTPERLIAKVQPTHLLHMAWNAEPGRYWTTPENLAWAQASFALYRAFTEAGGQRAVGAGTCAEYDWSHSVCGEDVTPLAPTTLYGAAKQAVGTLLCAYGAAHGPSTAWGRVFFLYGPHEHANRLVPAVVRGLLAGERVAVTHGRQVRDFMHVADVAAAFAALVAREDVLGPVNVASGEPISLRELIGQIQGRIEGPGAVDFGARETPAGEPPVLLAEVRRLRDEVGFTPRFDLTTGLEDAIAWWRARG